MKFKFLERNIILKMPKKAPRIFIVLFIVLVLLMAYVIHIRKDMADFGVCYQGGQRIIESETLYRVTDGHMQYKYSPSSAVFFTFYTLFPFEMAKFLWYLSELFLLYLVMIISYKMLPLKLKKKGTVIGFSFLILLKFSAREIEVGQVNFFTIFIFLVMLVAVLKKEDIIGGALWGFSMIFKPYSLVFLPYFILKKRFKLIAVGIVTLSFWFILPVFFYGFKGYLIVLNEWSQTLSQSTQSLIASYDNASLHAFFLNILPEQKKGLSMPLIICVLFLIGISFLWMMFSDRKKVLKKPEVLEFSFLFILIPLFSPLGWYYNYFFSILAVVILLNLIDKFPPAMKYGLIVNFVVIGGSLREILGADVFRFYTKYSLVVINFVIVLFYLFHIRIKKHS